MSNTDVVTGIRSKPRGRPRKEPQQEIVPTTEQPPAVLTDTAQIIRAITQLSQDPQLNIQNMQYLLDTRRALMLEQAEQGYNEAMARAQAKMRPISKDCENPQTRSKYASYVALDRDMRPIYSEEGFALTFDTAVAPNPSDILIVLDVTHGRFKRRYSIPMPCDGKGPKGNDVMTRTHAVGSAVTYGRRYLLGMAFNIVIGQDDDGNRAGQRYQQPAATYRPPRDDYVPAPPAPNDDERASHTRQAIANATAAARQRLKGQTEGEPQSQAQAQLAASLAPINARQLTALRRAMFAANVTEAAVCQAFEVEKIEDLSVVQHTQAIDRCNEKQRKMGVRANANK